MSNPLPMTATTEDVRQTGESDGISPFNRIATLPERPPVLATSSYDDSKTPSLDDSKAASLEGSKTPCELEASGEDRFASIDRKKLLRKIDFRIMVYVCITYMIVRLDLNNINNAGTMNKESGDSLKQVLKLDAKQWAWVVGCFYYPYMVSEPICTFFVKATSPSAWLSRIFISWGIVMVGMCGVKSYGGLIACRVLLGALEGSYFTSIIFYFASWYTSDEMASRVLYLYVANSSAGGVSGIFAWCVSNANGKTLYGWQVLFIFEGLLTILLGIGFIFILPDWPSTSKWLTPLEKEWVAAHLHKDAPKVTDKTLDWQQIKVMLLDPTFTFFTLFWMCWSVSAWGVSTMQTFLVLDLGVTDSAGTQLLQIPPSAMGIGMCVVSSYLIRQRGVSAFLVTLLIVGGAFIAFFVLRFAPQAGVRYAALCVISGAAPSAYACLWPRRVASIRGTSAAALGIGLLNAVSQFSGILGPQLFRTDFGPHYYKSITAAVVFVGVAACVVVVLWYLMEGDLSWSPYLKRRVLAQTQIIEGDEEAEKNGATIGRR